jgi:hypothetical protein
MLRAVLLASALLLVLPRATGAPAARSRCMDETSTEKVRVLVLVALDQALQAHFLRLFDVWMKDGDNRQPDRIRNGLRLSVAAYLASRDYVQQWSPPPCVNAR